MLMIRSSYYIFFRLLFFFYFGRFASYTADSAKYTNLNNSPSGFPHKGFLSIQIELFEEINVSPFGGAAGFIFV